MSRAQSGRDQPGRDQPSTARPSTDSSVPLRTCIGCRTTVSVDSLVRYVRNDDGSVVVGRHAPGRGAWVCATGDCLDVADRTGAFSRAFRSASRLNPR